MTHDSEMFEKDRKIKVLCDRLCKVKMELATLKLERLSAGTRTSVSPPTSTNFVGPMVGGASIHPLGPEERISMIPKWSGGLGTTTQSGVVTTTLPLLPSGMYAMATTTNNTQSMLPSDLGVAPSVQTSREQGHCVQPEEQVTNVSTSLSSALFTSRPVSSAGAATTGTFTATAAPWGSKQSQCRRGKAPPIDEFTSEDSRITFDD